MASQGQIGFEQKGIGEALEANFFRVPPNQREYAWEKEHIEDLFRDLSDAEDRNEPEYFLGMIVLTKRDGSLWIADGQQRLATTSILLAAIRDYLRAHNEAVFAEQIDTTFLRKSAFGSLETTPKLRLNTADNDFYERRILGTAFAVARSGDPKAVSNRRLETAATLAAEHVRERVATNSHAVQVERLIKTATFIKERATVVLVTTPDDLGAFRMFETLNDRGVEAAQSDLVKNYLLTLVEKDGRGAEVLQRWTSMLTDLGSTGSEEVVRYLRHYYYFQYGHVREHKLFEEIRERVRASADAVQFANDVAECASDYVALWRPEDDRWTDYGPTTRQHVEILRMLRVDQLRPLHLAVMRRFSIPEARKAFRLFVACSIRLAVGGGSKVGRIDRECAVRAVKIGRAEITTAKQLASAMAEIVPTDAEFEPYFAVATTGRADLARYVLRALEMHLKHDPAPELVPNVNQDVVNLEHILPKKPGNGWVIDARTAEGLYNRYGNLALLKKSVNKTIGNGSFAEKKKALKGSVFSLTAEVAKIDDWDADAIQERQKRMAHLAVETWPISVA